MRVISRKALKDFWERHAGSENALKAWHREARRADWAKPADIKAAHPQASIIGNNRVVFNILGNSYRLVVEINYTKYIVFIRFVGTHAEYDEIDAERI